MRVRVYTTQPYHNIPGYFIDRLGEPTFDPKHPSTYPGDEVTIKEVLTPQEFLVKYDRSVLNSPDFLYIQKGDVIQVLKRTGRTSADIVAEL